MKPSLLIFLIITVIIFSVTSCHKSKHSSPASAGNTLISGLTGIKRHSSFDSFGTVVTVYDPYVTWHFSGTNAVTATPDTFAYEYGYQQLSFSGSLPTQLAYINPSGGTNSNYPALTATVGYTPAGLSDTVTIQYAIAAAGAEKAVFQYNGTHIASILVAHSASPPADTFYWHTPDVYLFTYTGDNISQITVVFDSGSSSPDRQTISYMSDTRKNNFAGSMATFWQLEFLEQPGEFTWFNLPRYINADFLVEIGVQNITDAQGRLIERVTNNGASGYDTVFYYY